MPQEPFTPAGVQQKVSDLYALPNNLLLAQANLVRSDFRQWVKDNFLLNGAQASYLDGLDTQWISFASSLAGFAMEYRRPIQLVVGPVGVSKFIRTPNNLFVSNEGGFSPGGSLTFEIYYES